MVKTLLLLQCPLSPLSPIICWMLCCTFAVYYFSKWSVHPRVMLSDFCRVFQCRIKWSWLLIRDTFYQVFWKLSTFISSPWVPRSNVIETRQHEKQYQPAKSVIAHVFHVLSHVHFIHNNCQAAYSSIGRRRTWRRRTAWLEFLGNLRTSQAGILELRTILKITVNNSCTAQNPGFTKSGWLAAKCMHTFFSKRHCTVHVHVGSIM